jgi:hypothetical protein
LMRNGRDRRLGKPVMGHAIVERVLLFGTRSADYIRASGHSGCIEMEVSPPFENRPYTWLHPNASQISQIPLAPRAPSIHGPSRRLMRCSGMSGVEVKADSKSIALFGR